MPAVGRAPSTRGRVWAEEALLRYQVLLSVHQVPHVVVLQQRPVEGAVQGAGRAQVLVLGRRGQSVAASPQPSAQGGSGRDSMKEARAGLGGPRPRSQPLPTLCRAVLSHRQGCGGEVQYLDDHKALGVPGHAGEFGHQLPEPRPTFRINHPTWGQEKAQHLRSGGSLCAALPLPLPAGLVTRVQSP